MFNLNWEQELDLAQQRAVMHDTSPGLVLAGPGTGKTRILAYRMAWLVETGVVQPEHVLALTFTRKAAEELHDRVIGLCGSQVDGTTIETFHTWCLRVLREHGARLGLDPSFVVFDEETQNEVIATAFAQMGWGRDITPRDLLYIRIYLGQRKGYLIDPAYDPGDDEVAATYAQLGDLYQEAMRRYHALDYDDLLYHTVALLQDHDDIRQIIQNTYRVLLVDEGHDLNVAQYTILKLVAPPPSGQVMMVADDNQSIYGWRGARPVLVQRFRDEYRADVLYLATNYRSGGRILAAAQKLIGRNRTAYHHTLNPARPDGQPIVLAQFPNLASEHNWLTSMIQRLVTEEGYHYDDIAILYRTHELADALEVGLRRAHIPLQRIQRDNFFSRSGVQDVLRYLQLPRTFNDPAVRSALNFPRVSIDELTMLQLQSLADRAGLSLAEVARHIDQYPEVSPLTRAAIKDMLRIVDDVLLPRADEPVTEIVEALFSALEERRSPYHEDEIASLTGFAEWLRPTAEINALRTAVDTGIPLRLLAAPTVDALCAATILEHALREYLSIDTQVDVVNPEAQSAAPEGTLVIGLGLPDTIPADIRLSECQEGEQRFALSTVAWRLAQGLLVSYETLDEGRFVVYDLETTGPMVQRDEIIEIAAVTVDRKQMVGKPFHSLVRPGRGYIPRSASAIHGLTSQDVRDAPPIGSVLPHFLRYIGDAVLAGHNITRFDNILITRELTRCLERRLVNPTLDTLDLARRLLPRANRDLAALLRRYHLGTDAAHRALPDAERERDLLFALLAENRRQKELESLVETLPLVALGTLCAGIEVAQENESLVAAAARVLRQGRGADLLHTLLLRLSEESWPDVHYHLAVLQAEPSRDSAADQGWSALKRAWQAQLAAFTATHADPSLPIFLDYAALATDEDALPASSGAITLMTLHNAKGKEFPVVIIIGMEDSRLPDWRARRDENALEEERRVLYVGMTRARDQLYLSSVRDRGDGRPRPPSRFIYQLPAEHIEKLSLTNPVQYGNITLN